MFVCDQVPVVRGQTTRVPLAGVLRCGAAYVVSQHEGRRCPNSLMAETLQGEIAIHVLNFDEFNSCSMTLYPTGEYSHYFVPSDPTQQI